MKSQFHVPYVSRRNFLQRFGTAALGTTVLARTIGELKLLNSAVAAELPTGDYKALICVFLNGGNDSNNMIIPTIPAEWSNYAAIRGPALALPNADGGPTTALALNSRNGTGTYPANDFHDYGFHPAMPEMRTLFNLGVVAPVFNVGTLSFPLTKIQWTTKSVPRPPQLFSHSDQQTQWQTSLPDQPYTSGWGGRIADLFTAGEYNKTGKISMAVSLAGSNIFEVSNGNLAPQYSITTSGAVQLSGISGTRRTALDSILLSNQGVSNLQTKAYAQVFDHSIDQAESLTTALATNASALWLTKFVNPVITPLSAEEESDWEGCLSVPGLRGMVPRFTHIRYTGFDQYGDPLDRTAEGFHARVVQHECDHLIGKLYPMRIRDFSQFGYTDVLFPGLDALADD